MPQANVLRTSEDILSRHSYRLQSRQLSILISTFFDTHVAGSP
jgi:hypothetical protein